MVLGMLLKVLQKALKGRDVLGRGGDFYCLSGGHLEASKSYTGRRHRLVKARFFS